MNKRAAGMAGGIAAAVPAALFAALAGTVLHGQDVLVAGVEVPWGAAAALVLLGSVELWLGAAFRSVLPTAVCGALCYALAGWWSTLENGKRLIIGDLAGNIWIYGIAVVTIGDAGLVPALPAGPGPRRTPPAPRHPSPRGTCPVFAARPEGHAQSSRPRVDILAACPSAAPAAGHAPASLGPQPGTCPCLACCADGHAHCCPRRAPSGTRDMSPTRHRPRGMPFCT